MFFGGLLALALMAALVAPYFINWTQYRTEFEREATRLLGQPVTVAGDASARLLPFPSVTFEDVRVGPEDAPLVVADRFSMDAELAPFMQGEVLIYDMRLENPTVALELDENGLPNWPLQTNTPVSPARVSLESAQIINGTITLRDARADRTWSLDDFYGSVSADSLYGPFRIEGEGRLNDNPLSARVSTGTLQAEGFPLRTVAEFPVQNIEIIADGRITVPREGEATEDLYSGRFQMLPLRNRDETDYALEGDFAATARSLQVPEFRAEFGSDEDPYTVTGTARISGIEDPRYHIEVKGTQVTIAEAEGENGQAQSPHDPVMSLAGRLADVQAMLARLPLPPIPGSVDLDLPAVVAGGTTIREIQLVASPDDEAGAISRRRWDVKRFQAKLPGRTVIEASGLLQLPIEGVELAPPGFDGHLVLASRQPSGLAAWLTGSVDDAIRRLPSAGFEADVNFTPDQQTVRDLEIILGPANLTGSVVRVSDPSRRNTLDVQLQGEQIDVDALEALASVFIGDDGMSRFAEHDLDVTLDLTRPDIRGVELDTLSTSIRSRQNNVEIDRLSLTGLYGASVSATGTYSNGEGQDSVSVDATLVADNGARFVRGLAARYPDRPELQKLREIASADTANFSETRLDIVGSADAVQEGDSEASLSISGSTGGTAMSLTATAKGRRDASDEARLFLDGTLQNDQGERLLSQAGFDVFVIDSPGPLEAEISAGGTLAAGLESNLRLISADMLTEITGVLLEEEAEAPSFEGRVTVEARDIEPWVAAFGYRLPALGLGTSADLRAGLSRRDATTVVDEIEGTVNGNAVAGTLAVDFEETGPRLRGDLSLEFLNAGEAYAVITGDAGATIMPAIDGEGQERLFDDPILADHDVELALVIGEVPLPASETSLKEVSTTFTYRDGAMSVRDLEASFAGGTISGLAELQNSGGTVLLNAQIQAEDTPVERLLPQVEGALEGEVDGSLHVTGTGRSTTALLASLTGSGVVSTEDLTLSGVSADGFAELIRRADAIGYEITPQQIQSIARDVLLSGTTQLPEARLPVNVANGRLRISNVSLTAGDLTIFGEAYLNADSAAVAGEARLSLDPGDEAVAGPQPEVTVAFDTSAEDEARIAHGFTPMVGYVTQRALEREQARVEAMQARLLEKQRLRREVQLFRYQKQAALQAKEEQRLRALEEERAAREAQRAAENAAREDARGPGGEPRSDDGQQNIPALSIERLLDSLPGAFADEPIRFPNESLMRGAPGAFAG